MRACEHDFSCNLDLIEPARLRRQRNPSLAESPNLEESNLANKRFYVLEVPAFKLGGSNE